MGNIKYFSKIVNYSTTSDIKLLRFSRVWENFDKTKKGNVLVGHTLAPIKKNLDWAYLN